MSAPIIQKRTRTEVSPATNPVTYNAWSDWAVTTDAPPYTNTVLIEFQSTDSTDFKGKYLAAFSELTAEAIKDGSPYKESINFMGTELAKLGVSEADKGTLTAQFMANITTSITNNAMQIALTITDKNLKAESEVAITANNRSKSDVETEVAVATKQNKIKTIEHQEANVLAQKDYTVEKKTQLINTVKFNNMSQSLEFFKDMYGQHKLGSGTITTSMWIPPLTIAKFLAKSDLTGMAETTFAAITTSE